MVHPLSSFKDALAHNHLVQVLHQAGRQLCCGERFSEVRPELTDEIQRRYFDWLDSPIQRISGAESAPTISAVLEKAALPNEDTVAQALVDHFATPHGSR